MQKQLHMDIWDVSHTPLQKVSFSHNGEEKKCKCRIVYMGKVRLYRFNQKKLSISNATDITILKDMKLNIVIIFGGKSNEHEISLQSASNIFNAVDRSLFNPILLGIDKEGYWHYNPNYINVNINLSKADYFVGSKQIFISKQAEIIDIETSNVLATFNVAFPIVHGTYGEDGTLQGLLKMLDIPFVGPNTLGSAIAMDKDVTKRILRDSGIPIANFYTLYNHSPHQYSFDEIVSNLHLPLFCKTS